MVNYSRRDFNSRASKVNLLILFSVCSFLLQTPLKSESCNFKSTTKSNEELFSKLLDNGQGFANQAERRDSQETENNSNSNSNIVHDSTKINWNDKRLSAKKDPSGSLFRWRRDLASTIHGGWHFLRPARLGGSLYMPETSQQTLVDSDSNILLMDDASGSDFDRAYKPKIISMARGFGRRKR